VRRVLPAPAVRHVGPFIFFDEMGPALLGEGEGIDVRPHPHIGLETITYLFDGEILHRDSLGTVQPIRPGEVNWMTAGRGIVHSERTGDCERARAARLHGIQAWVALPDGKQEIPPAFAHYPRGDLPERVSNAGVRYRVIAGCVHGADSPVVTGARLFYAHVEAPAAADVTLPDDYPERAVYVVSGAVEAGGSILGPGQLGVIDTENLDALRAREDSRLMILGGDPPATPLRLWWNLVARSRERIDRAKADWREGRFPKVPGDNEYIPLPDS
jgi:redox-sensitive bicupin YhaK (pirin superfamily)